MDDFIKIKGAKIHNLKNIDVNIPKNKLTVITRVSGSGKSSLITDTLVPKLKELLKVKFLGGEEEDEEDCDGYSDVVIGGIEHIGK